jgi:hypothetical protein
MHLFIIIVLVVVLFCFFDYFLLKKKFINLMIFRSTEAYQYFAIMLDDPVFFFTWLSNNPQLLIDIFFKVAGLALVIAFIFK